MATKTKECYELIKKSQAKSNAMLERGITMYENIKAVRRTFLLYIRIFDDIKHDWKYNEFCRVLYKKSLGILNGIPFRIFPLKVCMPFSRSPSIEPLIKDLRNSL